VRTAKDASLPRRSSGHKMNTWHLSCSYVGRNTSAEEETVDDFVEYCFFSRNAKCNSYLNLPTMIGYVLSQKPLLKNCYVFFYPTIVFLLGF